MYTATPQAPLLINLADVLSPDFVSVLTPGAGYTGGEYFFEQHKDTFVRTALDQCRHQRADGDGRASARS